MTFHKLSRLHSPLPGMIFVILCIFKSKNHHSTQEVIISCQPRGPG